MSVSKSLIGQILGGRYRIDELLGQGGMSAVYKGYDPNLKRIVAIKIIHAHLANDPKFIVRFEEEAAAVAKLRHPNIVQVYDFNQDDGLYYMVLEFVAGETLQERLRSLNRSGRRIPVSDAIRYVIQICRASDYAHKNGFIHRDIKPANIILDFQNRAILMDFGIVKIVGGERLTAAGAIVGTAMYMSPEMIRGEMPDPRSDLYSLGIMLYEMVSGRPPFEADSAMTLMMMHMQDPIPDLRSLRPDVPDDLIALVERSLDKDREKRFRSMAEMASALERIYKNMAPGTEERRALVDQTDLQASQFAGAGALGSVTLPDSPSHGGQSTTLEEDQREKPGFKQTAATIPDKQMTDPDYGMPAATEALQPDSGYDNYPESPVQRDQPSPLKSPVGTVHVVQPTALIEQSGESSRAFQEIPTAGEPKKRVSPILWIGGSIGLLVALLAMFFAVWGLSNLSDEKSQETPVAVVAATQVIPSATSTAEAIATLAPSPTNTPQLTNTPTLSPTPTIPVGVPYARINGVSLDNLSRYVVDYETFEFTERLDGMHLLFLFDSLAIEEGYMYGGPRPFVKFEQESRPEGARQLCVLVVNPDHSARLESGNCMNLPDVVVATVHHETPCLVNPETGSEIAVQLSAGQAVMVRGISADESWWNVYQLQDTSANCWLPKESVNLNGDISILPLIEPPLQPSGSANLMSAEITQITADSQGRFSVKYSTSGFSEELPGTHLHFFFDTVPPDQVGMSGGGNRLMYGGPSPFTGFLTSDIPIGAQQICVLVADPAHNVIAGSGNCLTFPAQNMPSGSMSTPTAPYKKQPGY